MTDKPATTERSTNPSGPAELRRAAETRAHEEDLKRTGPQSPLQAQRLIHELRVHQIELEMQNDELQHALAKLEDEQKLHSSRVEVLERLKGLMQSREGRMAELKRRDAQLVVAIRGLPGGDQVLATLHDAPIAAPQQKFSRVSSAVRDASGANLEQIAMLNLIEDLESDERLHAVELMKDRFVAMASHELRTPLTTISGFSSTLLYRWDSIPDQDRRSYVQLIDDEATRMIRLVNNVLVMSRIHTGALSAVARIVDIGASIETVLHSFPGVEIKVTCPVGATAYVDQDHLQQALLNYVENAVRYGSQPIDIDVIGHASGIDIRVCDHGPGVSDAFVSQLFDEFAQAPPTDSGATSGAGLGLSIVRRLMLAQGGDAWYEPNDPTGACFMLRVPTDRGGA